MLLVLDIWLDAAAFYWNGHRFLVGPGFPMGLPQPHHQPLFLNLLLSENLHIINFIFIFRLLMKIEDRCRPKTDSCRILLEADLSNIDFPLSVNQPSYNPFNMVNMILFGSGFECQCHPSLESSSTEIFKT